MPFDRKLKKTIITFFIALNVFTVIFVNRPAVIDKAIGSSLSKFINNYSSIVGLSTKWLMFAFLYRENWFYVIKGRYADSHEVILPIPMQSKRSFLERALFDFKEVKFNFNFHIKPYIREHYASYLCRQFKRHNNSSIQYVVFEVNKQKTYSPDEARLHGKCFDEKISTEIVNVFKCNERGISK